MQRRTTFSVGIALVALGFLAGCDLPPNLGSGAATSTNSAPKLAALQAVVKHLKKFPDRFAPDSEREAYNDELEKLIKQFEKTPFSAKEDPGTARKIVELYQSDVEHKFGGYQYNILDGYIRDIYSEMLDR